MAKEKDPAEVIQVIAESIRVSQRGARGCRRTGSRSCSAIRR